MSPWTYEKILVLTFEEVRLEVYIKDIATETLDGVIEGKNVYTLAVLDI